MNKIIRSLCWFAECPSQQGVLDRLKVIDDILCENGYQVQTKRLCFDNASILALQPWEALDPIYLSVGMLTPESFLNQFTDFLQAGNVSLNVDLSHGVAASHVEILLRILQEAPHKTFQFAYTFHNRSSSPFFPSATFQRPGFAIGLQSPNLSNGTRKLAAWLSAMKTVWLELYELFEKNEDFLGIDASVAPLFRDESSLVHWVKTRYGQFSKAVTTDVFVRITDFLSQHNPKPVGLCGLMLPCLEDFELAEEYEAGRFSIERNLFLALHSGLGIDTYPVGMDEKPGRILEILRLLQKLSTKYQKPLSARFVSDGIAKTGEVTQFKNPFLKDVTVRPL